MKPKNFPERQRQRRMAAARRAGDAKRLAELAAMGSQRGVRTKKLLADASPARIAHHGGALVRRR